MAIWEGYIVGLAMIIFIGPVFFTLIQTTLQYGAKAGFAVALGIFISDVVIVMLCFFGATRFFESTQHKSWLAVIGSLLLFYIGLRYTLKPNITTDVDFKPSVFRLSSFFAKGFLVNFVNPFVFIVWITTIAYSETQFENTSNSIFFLMAALLGILTTDSLKVILAGSILKFLKPVVLRKVFFVTGLILFCFGIRLLYFAFIQ